MVDKPNMPPIGQDRETLTFKALLYLHVAVNASMLTVLRGVYPIVQLGSASGHPAITNILVVNQTFSYNGIFAMTKTPL